jgi:hypothetical protein
VRPRSRFFSALLLPLVAILACAKPPVPGRPRPEGPTIDVEGFVVPRSAEDFQLVQTHPFGEGNVGSQVRYSTFYIPAARIDLLLFPVIVPDLFSLSSVLHEQYLGMQKEVEQTAALAHGKVVLRSQHIEAVPGVSPPLTGIHADYDFVDEAQMKLRSHAFLAVRGRNYLKVRFTYAAENADVGEPAFERFLATAVAQVASSPAGDPPPVGITITRTTFDAGHQNRCAAVAWGLGYGSELHAAIGRGDYVDSFERELAARTRALDLWDHMKHKGTKEIPAEQCVDASLDAMADVRRLGLFREYVWHYYAKPYWSQQAGLDLAAFAQYEQRALAGHDPVRAPGVVIHYLDAP